MLIRIAIPALLFGALSTPLVHARQTPDTPVAEKPVVEEVKLPDLLVGSDAPALAIEKWLKGTPVASFEKGKVYMVEFWATWCGPCIRGMPHLTELQKKYREQGLTIIGVTSADSRGNTLESVQKMVAAKDEIMGYTVAWDSEQKTNDAFFTAAAQQGIPCAFLVDQNGKIAYIGHPMSIDQTLDDVMNKKHDIAALALRYKTKLLNEPKARALQQELGAAFQSEQWDKSLEACEKLMALDQEEYMELVAAKFVILGTKVKDLDKAYAWAREAHQGVAKNSSAALRAMAWIIVDPEQEMGRKDLDFALTLVNDANRLDKGKDASTLHVMARVHFAKGDVKQAVEVQTNALALADVRAAKSFQKALDEYKAELEKKVGG